MALHTDKTKFMLFTQNVQIRNMNFEVYINNTNSPETYLINKNDPSISKLQRVTSDDNIPAIRFLGVYFDPQLNFNYYIQLLCTKLSKSLYILRTSKNVITEKALKLIYHSLFHSHLVYCLPIWSCTSMNNLNQVSKLQKWAIRIISNARYNSHTEPLFKKHEILPLEQIILYFNLQFSHRFLRHQLPSLFDGTWQLSQGVGEEIHDQIQLRPRGTFRLNFTRLSICEKFPYFKLPRLWNDFPDIEIKNSVTKLEFNKKLKKFLIAQLSDKIICNRLLCPTCHLQN